jgi:hypothetical protein
MSLTKVPDSMLQNPGGGGGGGGSSGGIDGGTATSNETGTVPIDGGTATSTP